jgi:hypothetical protein
LPSHSLSWDRLSYNSTDTYTYIYYIHTNKDP